jgi:DNA-directed RNA polymerase
VQDMMEIQADLEARMASLGIERFRRNALEAREEGQATRSRSMQQVLDVMIDPTASAILKFRADAGSGRAGRRHSAVRFFMGLEAEVLAFIAAKLILDGYAQEQNLTRLAVRIGSTVELEQRLDKFMDENKAYMKTVQADLAGRTDHFEHASTCTSSGRRETSGIAGATETSSSPD